MLGQPERVGKLEQVGNPEQVGKLEQVGNPEQVDSLLVNMEVGHSFYQS